MRTLYEQPLHYIDSEKQTLLRFGGLLLLVGIIYPLKYQQQTNRCLPVALILCKGSNLHATKAGRE